jgi:HEAT repeat protein
MKTTAWLLFALAAAAQDEDRLDAWVRDLSARNAGVRERAQAELRAAAPGCWKPLEERAAAQSDPKLRELLASIAAQGRRRDPDRVLAAVDEIVREAPWSGRFPLPGFFETLMRRELADRDLEPTPETLSRALLKVRSLLDPTQAGDALLGSLANSLGSTATAATRAEVRGALRELLAARRPIVQCAAVDALVSIRAAEEGELLKAHARDGPLVVRLRAVHALAVLEIEGSAAALEALISDPEPQVRGAALAALAAVSRNAALRAVPQLLRDPAFELRAAGLELASVERPEGLTDSVAALVDDPEPSVRAAAVRYLGRIPGNPHASTIAARLGDDDPRVRRAAVTAAALLGLRDRAGEIERLLRDRDRGVVSAALQALWALDARASAPAVARLLGNSAHRAAASVALARLGSAAHLPALLAAAKSNDEEVAARAIFAIGEMRGAAASAGPELAALLDPRRPAAGSAAILALARLRHGEGSESVLETASKFPARRLDGAIDAYRILALDARDAARIGSILRGRDDRRAWDAQMALHELRDGEVFVRAMRRLFDPDARTVRALLEEMRRQLGLRVDWQLPAELLDRPAAAPQPMTLEQALEAVGEAAGRRISVSIEAGSVRFLPFDRAAAAWGEWLSRRGQ